MTNTILGSDEDTLDSRIYESVSEDDPLMPANRRRVVMEESPTKSQYIEELYKKTRKARTEGKQVKSFFYEALNGVLQSDYPDRASESVRSYGKAVLDYIL